MNFHSKALAMAHSLTALSPGLSFGYTDIHTNPLRQDRLKKMKHLGLKNMKQYRRWEKNKHKTKRNSVDDILTIPNSNILTGS
jgi:hypothetical protein